MRLDLALIRLHPTLSRRRARDVIEKGQVSVDGMLVREAGHPVAEGARIAWDPNRKALPRVRCSLTILHEDEHVLVVDKPAGLLSVPTSPAHAGEDTALRRVREYVARLHPREGYVERVHRLDRDTSGALAFALSRSARAGLIRLFRDHRIERVYLAIVDRPPGGDEGTIDAPLREDWVSGRRGVAHPGDPGVPAVTRWRVRERLAQGALLEVTLETGRQHQVRAHLAHATMPIVGDPVYGVPGSGPRAARRPMLHAWRLGLDHPVTGRRLRVESPIPDDFTRALRARRDPARRRASSTSGGPARKAGGRSLRGRRGDRRS